MVGCCVGVLLFTSFVVSLGLQGGEPIAGGLTTGWRAVVWECFSSHPLAPSPAFLALIPSPRPSKGCEAKHSHTTAHHPLVKPPAVVSTAVSHTPTRQQRMRRKAPSHSSPPFRGQASCNSLHGSVTYSNSATGLGKLPGTIL